LDASSGWRLWALWCWKEQLILLSAHSKSAFLTVNHRACIHDFDALKTIQLVEPCHLYFRCIKRRFPEVTEGSGHDDGGGGKSN
jgi:hypothetical protein